MYNFNLKPDKMELFKVFNLLLKQGNKHDGNSKELQVPLFLYYQIGKV